MPKIKVCLGTVIKHVNFSVLIGRHCARVDVEVGVELLDRYAKSTMFKKGANRCCGKSLS